MLILTRKASQRIMIDNDIILTILGIDKKWGQVRLGFEAPANINIVREEILGMSAPKYLSEGDLKCLLRHNTK